MAQTIYSGDDERIEFKLREDGSEYDLTNAQDVEYAAAASAAATPQITASDADGSVEVVDAAAGVVEVVLDPSTTEDLSGSFYQEILVTGENGQRTTFAPDERLRIAQTVIDGV